MSTSAAARAEAALAIVDVWDGRSLNAVLPVRLPRVADPQRPLVQAMIFGGLRWGMQLEPELDDCLRKPFKAKDQDLRALLLIGLFQLRHSRVPDHAAIAETVEATRKLGKSWASGLVNGVLRNIQRRPAVDIAQLPDVQRLAAPKWLLKQLQTDWPANTADVACADWEFIAQANNQQAPLTLRVNAQQGDRAEYLQLLDGEGLPAEASPHLPHAVTLQQAVPVAVLPGFETGLSSVQDHSAQWAAELLAPQADEYVLDGCAAPGGKTCAMLERGVQRLLAVDVAEERLAQIGENFGRLELDAELCCADLSKDDWWNGEPFDAVLLDVPCSATGVIRRHPDIKYLRRADDIPELCAEQAAILAKIWPMLKPGGRLLYTTCSVLKSENSAQVQRFVEQHGDAEILPLVLPVGRADGPGWQLFPSEADGDGFYYALLRKHVAA